MEFLLLLLLPLIALVGFGGGSDEDEPDAEPTEHFDLIDAGAGADTIDALGGDDLILGADGDDSLSGGAGFDLLAGEAGNDVLDGGRSGDVLTGGAGDDSLSGGNGNDDVQGGAGNDQIDGGLGNDLLIGGGGVDTLSGGAGSDLLNGLDPSGLLPGEAIVGQIADPLRAYLDGLQPGESPPDVVAALNRLADDTANFEPGTLQNADILNGGSDADLLIGDGGDVMTGGTGQDTFSVYTYTGDDPVQITDYLTSEPLIFHYSGNPDTLRIDITDDPANSQTLIQFDGATVLVLQNIAASQVNAANISLRPF